jgi:putative membrane protein
MANDRILREAVIAPSAVRYKVLGVAAGFTITVFGILLLPFAIPITYWYWSRYYGNLRVLLTTREIKVHRGVMVREEKSIPLEKITDLAVYQGPIMRWMDLKGIRVETAGQSSGMSALVSIVGLDDTDGFRDRVLAQRDRITDRDDAAAGSIEGVSIGAGSGKSGSGAASGEALAMLEAVRERDGALLEVVTEIRDLLRRLESSRP